MKVRFLAADSFGVRSMATLVESSDVKIGIDTWAALGPKRYGLPPHPREIEALEAARKLLEQVGTSVDVHIITHYHFDHYCPTCKFYEGKKLLGKDWEKNINKSQRTRFSKFLWKDTVEKIDGRVFKFGDTLVEFSPPVPHGEPDTKMGYVIMVYVEENMGFLYTSDVEGPVDERALRWILEREPDIVYVDGALSYLKGYRVGSKIIEMAEKNMEKIIDAVPTVIIDHHAARNIKFYDWVKERGIFTASSYQFGDNLPLEALRKDLWKGNINIEPKEIERRYKF